MSGVLIDGCAIATVDAAGTEVADGWILADGPRIAALGPGAPPEVPAGTTRIDGRGCLATPGLVNCHHHLWQWSTRGLATEENLLGAHRRGGRPRIRLGRPRRARPVGVQHLHRPPLPVPRRGQRAPGGVN
jgi:cytosine/adenosine deaminase-related metal-dependent hydrolase